MNNDHFRKGKRAFRNDPRLNPINFTKALKEHNYLFNY